MVSKSTWVRRDLDSGLLEDIIVPLSQIKTILDALASVEKTIERLTSDVNSANKCGSNIQVLFSRCAPLMRDRLKETLDEIVEDLYDSLALDQELNEPLDQAIQKIS